MAIITYPLNNIDYSAEDAEMYNSSRTSGVYATESNLDYSLTGAMKIAISTGLAWIRNSTFSGKCIGVKAPVELTLDAADATLPRIDRIVLGFDASTNASSIYVKKGTPGSAPVPNARSTTASLYELVLYDVLIGAGATMITAANVTDQRANDELCGLMRDAITRNPPAPHADSHAEDGEDPITPAMIGAEAAGTCIPKSQRGAANGVSSLTADKKVSPDEASSLAVILTTSTESEITLALSHAGKMICYNNTTDITVNVPAEAAAAFPVGTEIEFCRYNTGNVTFAAATGVTLCSVNNAHSLGSRYSTCGLKKLAANLWLLTGDLS